MTKVLTTILSVVVAVGVFTALWVGANLIFNQATKDFKRFSALAGGALGLILMTLLDGNRLITGIGVRPAEWDWGALHVYLFWPVVGAIVGAAIGWILAGLDDARLRLGFSVAAGIGIGVLIGFLLKGRYQLAMRTTPLIIWPVVGAAVGAGLNMLRRRNLVKGTLTGLFFGWLFGSFGGAFQAVDQANLGETLVASTVAGGLAGARLGLTGNPDIVGRAEIDQRSRSWIFVGPAFLFYTIMLIIPAFQTFLLSLKDRESEEWVGFVNYREVFTDPNNLDLSGWQDSFGSAILPWVLLFLVCGLLLAALLGRETAQPLNFGGAPIVPIGLAVVLFGFVLFTNFRGTIVNNIWWVVGVTTLSTALGLAIAKMSDGAAGESVAKSFVFMPMAISMVGASIIWRLMMYQARDTSKAQTGVFNALWVWLGQVSTKQPGQIIIGLLFIAVALALGYAAYRNLARSPSTAGLYMVFALVPLWVAYRTFIEGIGGYVPQEDGTFAAQTVNFVQSSPFNNFWLMLIMVWIQTGFAMVILSAAIKAVPEDFIEAAKIDGATDGQIFWRITVPQVWPTILVVATTIMVAVMKVFDFVKVTTNGQFDTQVLANAMFQEAFLNFNRGVGAALAIILFIGVVPVMVWNVNNLTKEA